MRRPILSLDVDVTRFDATGRAVEWDYYLPAAPLTTPIAVRVRPIELETLIGQHPELDETVRFWQEENPDAR